ncbi:ORMDL family protein [Trichomonas vaginalis G3]|uniref:ORMDL family protein n=1 Tax=Trichomonas vaginalis (strain ATCC PRA-98 / G3) TaxID=412133 RepID=A2DRR9_TRIV3|nr:negative regulation of ceramide biosynthetic process [Trichomonas vaginalis G3]EAY16866.1 ORMDL family protein [Trichomonas vaginalis G3]KAI5489147.1 negative regulation of ceramide biosynthetic process [Trichomonas vaginalis G3]|eukprot:XP_001329089.1 ORMDL family protein [Trichomonas vaginalis G3]
MKKSSSLPAILNKNVQFIDNPVCWVFYTLLFLFLRIFLSGLGFSIPMAWTLVSWVHGIVTIILFHWIKGSPFIDDHGAYSQLTFWEQIDDQLQNTRARKFLIIFPIILFFLAVDSGHWELAYIFLNFPILFVCILAKLPFMHGVRIFGING